MLKSLLVKDFALIENILVEFTDGLNIITGETGAGKSILVGALGLLIGERASSEVIRKDATKSIVEGIFLSKQNPKLIRILSENEIEFEDEIIIRREISQKGNRIFINDTPINLQIIKEIGDLLVDMHGQHAHQSLLDNQKHIEFLDQFLDSFDTLLEYKNQLAIMNQKKKDLANYLKKDKEIREKIDLYQFQRREIINANLHIGEDISSENELNILENSEYLFNTTKAIAELVYDGENSVFDKLAWVQKEIESLAKIDPSFEIQLKEIQSALNSVEEVANYSRNYNSKIDLSPNEVDLVRNRFSEITTIKKKYNKSIEELLLYKEDIHNQIQNAESYRKIMDDLIGDIIDLRFTLGDLAFEISQQREKVAEKLIPKIQDALSELGMPDAKFQVNITQNEINSPNTLIYEGGNFDYFENGFDLVEFWISTNLGEDLKPLAKIASGGEISRVMLAFKSAAAEKDSIPILIFDEIDTGISGRIGEKVAKKMKNLGKSHQVLAITHLPQIASFGDSHFSISKENENGRVVSKVIKLSENERIIEIAKLLGGEILSDSAMENAKELLNIAAKSWENLDFTFTFHTANTNVFIVIFIQLSILKM